MHAIFQALIGYILSFLWKKAEEAIREGLIKAEADKLYRDHVKDVLSSYEKVIKEAEEKAKDGLTKEEIEEIRRKKIELEERLINEVPRT